MKKTIITSLLLVFTLIGANSQRSESDIALREYFIDAEFFLAQEFYLDALNDYMQVYKRGYENNANINYRIGICYLNIPGQKDKAIDYFRKARGSVSKNYKESTLNEKNAPYDVYLYLGNAFRVNNMLDSAITSYNKFISLVPEEEVDAIKYANQQIEACNIANEFMSNPSEVEFTNMGEVLNTSGDDYKAVISGDGNTLLFMRRLPFYDAIYYSTKGDDGKWSRPENITPQIMSDGDQFISDVSYDGKTILLTREDEFNSDILMSNFVDNRWEQSIILNSNINTKYWESHACLSKDAQTMYFTSNRKGGAGLMDIYVSQRGADGLFGPASNVSEINTSLNEDTPFITDDGKLLFFSSQSYTNMGGYDVFVSKLEADSVWGLPSNLGYPLSTTDDDLFYYPMNNGKSALISRIDEDGYGAKDIYGVDYKEIPAFLIEETPAQPEEVKPEPATEPAEITGDVAPGAAVVPVVAAVVTDETKEEVKPAGTTQEPSIEESGPKAPDTPVAVTLPIKIIEIKPVLFGFDKSVLTAEGKVELDKIVKLMKEHSSLSIVLTGFADPLGPESYNLRLSEYRAKAALNYLISKGIEGPRLKAIGKGETNFIAVNTKADGSDSPEGRRYNRRVEFEISGADPSLEIIRIDPVPPELKIK